MKEPKKKSGPSTTVVLTGAGLVMLLIMFAFSFLADQEKQKAEQEKQKLTPEQRKELELKEQKKAQQYWYDNQSHNDCEDELKKNLRNPSTYSRDGNIVVVKDDGKQKTILWKYRAENGFGGLNYSAITCFIKNKIPGEYQLTPLGQL